MYCASISAPIWRIFRINGDDISPLWERRHSGVFLFAEKARIYGIVKLFTVWYHQIATNIGVTSLFIPSLLILKEKDR